MLFKVPLDLRDIYIYLLAKMSGPVVWPAIRNIYIYKRLILYMYIYIYLLVCLSAWPFVSNKRENDLIVVLHISPGKVYIVVLHISPGKVYKMIKFFFLILPRTEIWFALNFENPQNFFLIKSANFCLFSFYKVLKEIMFTVEIEDGREAP